MAQLLIHKLSKTYDKKFAILSDISFEAKCGEFIVLVGPSGCGKSTLLRTIAGLEDVTSGTIQIGDRVVNELPPAERDIAMVFQDYALYPHMTVQDNLSFGLKIQKMSKELIAERVKRASVMLNIEHLLDRKPSQLSGGQRQRVAIGRAIVRKPSLFLFDEPLSNLDAQLRGQTRIELASLHNQVKSTVIYVTHDQVEAMTLADRIVVLNKGQIQQIGAPLELYHHPKNIFVATFLGHPKMNLLKGHLDVSKERKTFTFRDHKIDLSETETPASSGEFYLGLRPESIKILTSEGRESQGSKDLNVRVLLQEPHGHESHLIAEVEGQQVIIRTANPKRLHVMESAHAGDFLEATIDRKALHWFNPINEERMVDLI